MSDLVARAGARLQTVGGVDFDVFASAGCDVVARGLANRAARTWEWMAEHTEPAFERPTVLVLTEDDWSAFAPMPVYGMPQAWTDRLVIAASSGDMWHDFTGTLGAALDDAGRERLKTVYGDPPDIGTDFAQLAIAHEVGHFFHAFTDDGSVDFARLWIAELFANVALYGYVASVEPDNLSILETVCELAATAPSLPWVAPIAEMGGGSVSGYIWAQLLLILLARQLWSTVGPECFTRIFDQLRSPALTDMNIASVFRAIDPALGAAIDDWPSITTA